MAKRKKKQTISKDRALQTAFTHAFIELSKRKLKVLSAMFALFDDGETKMMDLGTVPDPETAELAARRGFKEGATYVVLTICVIDKETVRDQVTAILYHKDLRTEAHIAPFKVIDGKCVSVERTEKGFHIFMED